MNQIRSIESLREDQENNLESQYLLSGLLKNAKDHKERQQWKRSIDTMQKKFKELQRQIDALIKNDPKKIKYTVTAKSKV